MPIRRRVLALASLGPCVVALTTSGCVLRTIEDFGGQDSEADTSADPTTSGDPPATSTDPFDPTTSDEPQLSHALHIQPIWDAHCTEACHSDGGEWAFLDLADAYGNIVGVVGTQTQLSFIEPGNPDASYLWRKLDGTQAAAGGGGLDMPKGRGAASPTELTPAELDLVLEWIQLGAPP